MKTYSFIFVLLIAFHSVLLSEERAFSGSYEDGIRLIYENRCLDAENLATILIEKNPADPNAELLITRAWICLGREENKRKNYPRAIAYLLKAQKHWPLNSEIKSELEAAYQGKKRKVFIPTGYRGSQTNPHPDQNQSQHISEIKELLKEILTSMKLSEKTDERRDLIQIILFGLIAFGIFTNLFIKIRSNRT